MYALFVLFLVSTFCSSYCLPLFLDSSYSEVFIHEDHPFTSPSFIRPIGFPYFQERQRKHVCWTKKNNQKNNCYFSVKKAVQIMQNAILKKSSAFYWDQLCETLYRYAELCSSNMGEETRVRRGSCLVWVLASHPEGWLASQIMLLAHLIKEPFQEITKHDASFWMGRCEKW